jgi:D-tyrosyl-tRNA(Tyr) deacylase
LRAAVQRVPEGQVVVDERVVAQIKCGCLVFVGVRVDDTPSDSDYISDKIANLRIFEDDSGKMNLSLLDTGGSALIVSQFTLYGDARKGRRPSFSEAAGGEPAKALYDSVCDKVAALGVPVQRGVFGAEMKVQLINDGPVTILLDSRRSF